MKTYKFSEISVGQQAEMSLEVTDKKVRDLADLCGDYNPVHLDDEFARKSFFKKRIAHGILAGSLISSVLGTQLPGVGSVYLNQNYEFKRPVGIGDTITAKVEVVEKIDRRQQFKLHTWVENQNGEVVLDGFATVMLL